MVVETLYWACVGSCMGPEGEKPFSYHDAKQMEMNDAAAREIWKATYNEDMPTSAFKVLRSEMPKEDLKMVGWTVRHSVAMVGLIGGYLDHTEVCKKTKVDPKGCNACIFDITVEQAVRLFETRET